MGRFTETNSYGGPDAHLLGCGVFNGFHQFHLPEILLQNLNQLQFTVPTPIQEKAVPIAMSGRDILGCAQTGTGKTARIMFIGLVEQHAQMPVAKPCAWLPPIRADFGVGFRRGSEKLTHRKALFAPIFAERDLKKSSFGAILTLFVRRAS